MNDKEVCKTLRITSQQLAAWRKKGLPHTGKNAKRRYNEAKVAAWLIDNGLAERETNSEAGDDEIVEHTIGAAVQTLARIGLPVDKRTFQDWMLHPDFPGRAGSPGRRDGEFRCRAIKAWRLGMNVSSENPEASRRTRLLDLQIASKSIELAKMQGEVIDFDLARTLFNQNNTIWLTAVNALPQEIASLLPSDQQAEARRLIETRINKTRETVVDNTKLQLIEIEKVRKASMTRLGKS
jgi:hypothetical protein